MKNKVSREDLEKALNNINEPLKLDIIKGKAAMIGEVRVWNGKKYKKEVGGKWVEVSEKGMTKKGSSDTDSEKKEGGVRTWNGKKFKKQTNGKYLEVSEHGMTKKEHKDRVRKLAYAVDDAYNRNHNRKAEKLASEQTEHYNLASKLSDKEYDDTDFEEKEAKKSSSGKHFELDKSDSIKVGRATLYRLKATKDSLHAKKGEKGGYVEKPENISDNAWVSDNAKVSGDAKISGNAKVYGNAKISGKAQISGDARVFGDAWVSDNAEISGDSWVTDNAEIYGNAKVYDDAQVYGKAQISGNAKIYGKTEIYGIADISSNAKVYGNAQISGNAKVYDDAQIYGDAQISGNAKIYGKDHVSGNDKVFEGTSEIKKSLEDHFSIINAPLSFDKSEDIQKSDVYYAIDESNVSSQSSIGKFKKKGSELKAMAAVKKAKYETKKAAIEVQKTELASKIKGESGVECIEGEYGCRFNYNYDTTPQNIRTLISQYNNLSYGCEGINKDIKALNVIIKYCEDDKMYDVTARQLISLDDE